MSSFYPLQKICLVPQRTETDQFLLVASGPELSVIVLSTGKIVNQWPMQQEHELEAESHDSMHTGDIERPHKRQKLDKDPSARLSRQPSEASEASVEIVAERKKGERRRPKLVNHKLPNISHLLVTRNAQYVVVVTADDKTVTVLGLTEYGQLHISSQRTLPKRLCAIQLTSDETTILTADKFGDVYAIPLLPSSDWVAKVAQETGPVSFTPSATELTVHTKGNLEALKQQRELKHVKKEKKDSPNFEHKLILGHVSLLTDLAIAEGTVNGRQRSFILTADRDEHIRVSRGIPQAHIIETYCLDHREFVSKLCIIPWAPDILVAGNGEPSLRVYKWQQGDLLQVYALDSLTPPLSAKVKAPDGRSLDKVAVSGIWPIQIDSVCSGELSQCAGLIIVSLEGTPLLLMFSLNSELQLQLVGSQEMQGNILDVVQVGTTFDIIVSLDQVHEPYSVQRLRSEEFDSTNCLQRVRLSTNDEMIGLNTTNSMQCEVIDMVKINLAECVVAISDAGDAVNGKSKENERIYSPIGEFLYGLENLRKKKGPAHDEEVLDNDSTPCVRT